MFMRKYLFFGILFLTGFFVLFFNVDNLYAISCQDADLPGGYNCMNVNKAVGVKDETLNCVSKKNCPGTDSSALNYQECCIVIGSGGGTGGGGGVGGGGGSSSPSPAPAGAAGMPPIASTEKKAPTRQAYVCQPPDGYKPGGLFEEINVNCAYCGNCGLDDFLLIGVNIFNYILGVVGSLMLLMFIIGGAYLLTSGGSSEKIEKGKKYLVNAIIGGIIVFGAFNLVNFLIDKSIKKEYQTKEGISVEIKK